jgi:hypothetical protein
MRGASPRDGTRSIVTSRLPAGAVTLNEPSIQFDEGTGVFFVGSINSLQGGKTVKTVHIPKRKLLFAALAVVALVGVALAVLDIEASSGDGESNAAAKAAADGLPERTGITLTEAEVEAATSAAGHALGEVMRLDHAEGREAWETRIEPLCTPNGLSFWTGPLFGDQVWPTVIEREYATQDVDLVAAEVIGEGDSPGSVTIEVTMTLTYVLGENDEPIQEESVNQVVMVNQDGRWLMDGPPAPSYWSSER